MTIAILYKPGKDFLSHPVALAFRLALIAGLFIKELTPARIYPGERFLWRSDLDSFTRLDMFDFDALLAAIEKPATN